MRTATKRLLVSMTSAVFIALFLGSSLLSFPGCGTVPTARREAKALYDGTENPGSAYKKTVVALPFESKVQWIPADFGATFTSLLRDRIEKESRKLRVLLPEDADFPGRFKQPDLLETEAAGTYKPAAAGRDAGANMILSVKLESIRHETEDRGMFWFAKVVHVARIQMQISMFHTGTGAMLLDRSVFYSIDISEAAGGRIDAGEMPDDLQFSEAVDDISETMGKLTGDILKYIPWEGYISRVEGDRIILSAGQYSGLKAGRDLAVYDTAGATGDDGSRQFSIRGEQIGTITITAVYTDHCDAVTAKGGPFGQGDVVRSR